MHAVKTPKVTRENLSPIEQRFALLIEEAQHFHKLHEFRSQHESADEPAWLARFMAPRLFYVLEGVEPSADPSA